MSVGPTTFGIIHRSKMGFPNQLIGGIHDTVAVAVGALPRGNLLPQRVAPNGKIRGINRMIAVEVTRGLGWRTDQGGEESSQLGPPIAPGVAFIGLREREVVTMAREERIHCRSTIPIIDRAGGHEELERRRWRAVV